MALLQQAHKCGRVRIGNLLRAIIWTWAVAGTGKAATKIDACVCVQFDPFLHLEKYVAIDTAAAHWNEI